MEKEDNDIILELIDIKKTYKLGNVETEVLKGINLKIKKGVFGVKKAPFQVLLPTFRSLYIIIIFRAIGGSNQAKRAIPGNLFINPAAQPA